MRIDEDRAREASGLAQMHHPAAAAMDTALGLAGLEMRVGLGL